MDPKRAQVFYLRCMARYTGRIDAELELGDRILVILNDGAAILHSLDGVKPKNWMPSGSVWSFTPGLIRGEHIKRSEVLEIYVEDIWSEMDCEGTMHGKLVKLGSEREMSDLLATRVDLIDPKLTYISREWRTPVGPIDLLCKDQQGNPVAIEVKRAKVAGAEVAYQLLRYLHALKEAPEWADTTPRGYLVAPTISKSARAAADTMGMTFVRLRYEDLLKATGKTP